MNRPGRIVGSLLFVEENVPPYMAQWIRPDNRPETPSLAWHMHHLFHIIVTHYHDQRYVPLITTTSFASSLHTALLHSRYILCLFFSRSWTSCVMTARVGHSSARVTRDK